MFRGVPRGVEGGGRRDERGRKEKVARCKENNPLINSLACLLSLDKKK